MLLFGVAAAQLPRAAAALRGVVDAPPRRAGRHAARAAARQAHHAGRRPHLLHGASRSRTRSSAASTSPRYLYDLFGLERRVELSTRPENKLGTDEEWDFAEGALARRSSAAARVRVNEGDGAFYGPKIDLHMSDVARALLADGHDPARRPDAAALRPHLHGRRQRRAHAVGDPPRAARLVRALHRDPHRALRRRVPVLARAGAGARDPGRRAATARPRTSSREKLAPYRVEVDDSDETVGKRIRNAELEKIPFVVVYGDKESRRRRSPCASTAAGSRPSRCADFAATLATLTPWQAGAEPSLTS